MRHINRKCDPEILRNLIIKISVYLTDTIRNTVFQSPLPFIFSNISSSPQVRISIAFTASGPLCRSCLYEFNQIFQIIKIIIVSVYTFPVINNPLLFIPLKAVQKIFLSIPSGKFRKSIRFDFA